MHIKEYFQFILANRLLIEQGELGAHINHSEGLCHNVVEFTEDSLEEQLQEWLQEYFNCIDKIDVPDYPFGQGNTDERYKTYLKYSGEKLNMYGRDQYGLSRWNFIEFVCKKIQDTRN